MNAFAAFLAPSLRYIMLAIALYVVARMVLALFFKKTTIREKNIRFIFA